jgi:hypothetical protein
MSDLATQFPVDPSFVSVNFKVNTPSQITNTMSGKLRRIGLGVSFYSWEVQYSNLTPLEAGTVRGYVAQALGPQFSFEIVLPKISYSNLPNQTASTPQTVGATAIGSISVNLANCGNTQPVLAAGDYFRFNSGTKVYQCVSPCTSDASGNAVLYFSGPAVATVASGTALTITAVPFTCVFDGETQEWEVGNSGITNMSLSMREVW